MPNEGPKPVIDYVSPSHLTFRNEGGCAILSLACPFIVILALIYVIEARAVGLPALGALLIWPVLSCIGLWLAGPATRPACPGHQRVIAWVGLIFNGLFLISYGLLLLRMR